MFGCDMACTLIYPGGKYGIFPAKLLRSIAFYFRDICNYLLPGLWSVTAEVTA